MYGPAVRSKKIGRLRLKVFQPAALTRYDASVKKNVDAQQTPTPDAPISWRREKRTKTMIDILFSGIGWTDIALTLNRIAVGMFFMLSGYHKLFTRSAIARSPMN